ncbi:NAD-dependent epimerase/dehydratase family protein [Nocardia vinacea]|uniref:NAD-dependent epimerase/dehydratase family protein n=1 Tax=Nocardia vinacea TaxID=96468 RepID=UPI0012F6785D
MGSHLCRALIARGDRVTAIDNPSTGHRENLSDLLACPEFRLVVGDITTHRSCRRGALRGRVSETAFRGRLRIRLAAHRTLAPLVHRTAWSIGTPESLDASTRRATQGGR